MRLGSDDPRGRRWASLIAGAAVTLMIGAAPGWAATITVDTTADDQTVNGNCTLREAITASNSDGAADACTPGSGVDTIEFGIGAGGPHTIQPTSGLPAVTAPVTIDAYTETTASENTLAVGNDAVIMVELDGQLAGPGVDGLTIDAGSTTVRGLAINDFTDDGLSMSGGTNNTVEGSFIGTNPAGGLDEGNGDAGIAMFSAGHQIGGADPADRNLISGNTGHGISFVGSSAGATVQGNYIGSDAAGTSAIANGSHGVQLNSSGGNQIGGTAVGEGNLISANAANGILITGGFGTANAVEGNLIGTDTTGTSGLGNGLGGIQVLSDENTIGGATAAAKNLISGNAQEGISLSGDDNVIAGNTIGLTADGLTQLGNGGMFSGSGVDVVAGAVGNTIGGTGAGEGNLISGNTVTGVRMQATGTSGNLVQGNVIGLASDGTRFGSPAQDEGVRIWAEASDNTIGGTAAGAGNVISGNEDVGVYLEGAGTSGNAVHGNLIGLDPSGTLARGNADPAVPANLAYKGGVGLQAPGNEIGGDGAGEGNVISFNGQGVALAGANATGNLIRGNAIGTDLAGTADFGNVGVGLFFTNASGNLVGGAAVGEGNLIANNGDRGVFLADSGSVVDNALLGNSIFANNRLGIDLESAGEGPDFITANDGPGDADAGPNHLQNFPELSAVATGSTHILGSLESEPGSTYRIEAFASAAGDPSGHGEGKTFLGATEVETNAAGLARIAVTLDGTSAAGDQVSATATKLAGDGTPLSTSEFSENATVIACPAADPGGEKLTGTPADDILCGGPGNDKFVGLGGDDLLIGSGGKDMVKYGGAAGPVKLDLRSGLVKADGDGGWDALISIENVRGSGADDRIKGDRRRNRLRGGAGDDLLAGRSGRDKLFGQAGDDVLKGGGGVDRCRQGAGSGALRSCEK